MNLYYIVIVFGSIISHVSPHKWSFKYDWNKFPAAWFGSNATNWESAEEIEEIGKYSMAILGWQHLITATNWTDVIYAQMTQASIIKSKHPNLPVFLYTGFGNANGYNAFTWPLMKNSFCENHVNQPCKITPEPYTNFFMQSSSTPEYSMSGCEQMGMGYKNPYTPRCVNLFWNFANSSARDYFVNKLITPLAAAPMIDGVFFDCFNYAYDIPAVKPWNRKVLNIPNCTDQGGSGCEALLAGTLDVARRTAEKLNAAGKVPMYANPASFENFPKQTIWLNESRLVDALKNTQWFTYYEFMRAEKIESSGQLNNMLQEGKFGVSAGVHTYYKNSTEDPTAHIAAFLLVREENWYYFGSTGWFDKDFHWNDLYNMQCGKPLGPVSNSTPSFFTRRYENCTVSLDCTDPSTCKGKIKQ